MHEEPKRNMDGGRKRISHVNDIDRKLQDDDIPVRKRISHVDDIAEKIENERREETHRPIDIPEPAVSPSKPKTPFKMPSGCGCCSLPFVMMILAAAAGLIGIL